ncbi:hypothetical protein ACMA5K_24115 [Bradyrhizobium diazoefficiens]|uniref:hypothetical protein n=1 Tax=Bradyrhizobium diazoefficiens TaxID=1355477 RepID=UPI000BE9F47C|nr:hypothetical protein [Bradyrhizobium diazoefficiens]PDT58728.1 hypothetical protein CO678_26210 [Bradyrhizobium diazoefficiens]QLD43830.1 hypothetical protein HUW42_23895 [Bradyrhizobium diazoefficiens]
MTELSSYSTGTVSVAAGGTIVTGVGTIWSGTNARPGDILQIGNFQSVISDVTDVNHLVVPPWGGGAQASVAYKIWQVSPQRFAGAQAMQSVNDLVAALNTSGFFVFVDVGLTEPDPSLGDDGQYAFQPTTGKTWFKAAGVWTYLGIYKGLNFTGAYNAVTTYSLGDVMSDAGSSYIWINPTPGAGHAAPNPTYWMVNASKGDPGATGATGAAGTNGTNGAGYGGTSTTSRTIGVGSRAFTTQAGLAYTNGARVRASSAANTANWMEGLATYSGTTLTIDVDRINGSGTLADWNFNVVGQPGAGDLSSANNLSDLSNKSTARDNLGVPQTYGQCRLTLSGGNLVLAPFNGNVLTIAGVPQLVPDAGVSLAATGLTPATTYFIYAFMNSGTMTLEASTTGHATSTTAGNKGTEIKSGDNTRTLVGMARPVTGPAWVDSATQAFVLSWFNRGLKGLQNHITATRNVITTAFSEFNSEVRCEFLTWSDEAVTASVAGSGYTPSSSLAVYIAVAFDNASTPEDGMFAFSEVSATVNTIKPCPATGCRRLSEGYHFATIAGAVDSGGTLNLYFNAASNGKRSGLVVALRG